MAVYANDWIGINLNLYGIYERDDLSVIFDFFTPLHSEFASSVALDIGSNVGNHAIFFDKYFSRTIAFEPNPSTYEILKFNARHSKAVTAFDTGLGDVAGEFDLWEDSENFGGSAIKEGAKGGVVRVKVERLDDLGLELSGLGLIKIDVEGFEANVVRGAKCTIGLYQPIILFEQHTSEFKHGEPETVRLLREMGYAFCWVGQRKVARIWLARRLSIVADLLRGGRLDRAIFTSSKIPPATYPMIIGVPEKCQKILGL